VRERVGDVRGAARASECGEQGAAAALVRGYLDEALRAAGLDLVRALKSALVLESHLEVVLAPA